MVYPPMLVNLLPTTKTRINARLYQERPCAVDLLTAFDTDTLIDESDRNNSFIIFSPPLKPQLTDLTSFVRGNIHISFPLFNIRSFKIISIVVYLRMYNLPLVTSRFLA